MWITVGCGVRSVECRVEGIWRKRLVTSYKEGERGDRVEWMGEGVWRAGRRGSDEFNSSHSLRGCVQLRMRAEFDVQGRRNRTAPQDRQMSHHRSRRRRHPRSPQLLPPPREHSTRAWLS